jgi:hypothetical protein
MEKSYKYSYISEAHVEKVNNGIYSAPPALAAPYVPTIRTAVSTPSTL